MKPATIPLLATLLAAALAGCGSHKTTIQTRNGTATVTTSNDDKSVTVQTNEGTMAIGQGVDPAKLGAPVYPGALAGQPESITTATGRQSTVIAGFTTADAFDKVYVYYKQRLPAGAERMKVTSGNGSVASFQVGNPTSPDAVTVQISSDKPNVTSILITHTSRTPH
jgi:hypothetical protein